MTFEKPAATATDDYCAATHAPSTSSLDVQLEQGSVAARREPQQPVGLLVPVAWRALLESTVSVDSSCDAGFFLR